MVEKSFCKSANVHLNKKKKEGGEKNTHIELQILHKGFSGKPHIYI